MNKLRLTEAFGGIGSQRRALQALGIPFEVVEYIEFDEHAVTSYNAIYNENFEPVDITQLECLKPTDMLTYSFPCQDISVAGKGKGIVRGATRSGLLYEVERLLLQAQRNDCLPKYLLLENVKNLVGKKFKNQFDDWIDFLSTLGYETQWFVLNAKDYGMAQNRERVFAVSVIGGVKKDLKPTPIKLEKALINYLDTVVDDKYYCKYENTSCLNMIAKGTFGATGVINTKPICLNSKGGRNGIEGLQPSVKDRIYDSNAIAPCVTTSEFFMPKFTHQIDVFEPIAYDEQNQYLRKDGCVGTLTTDGHSPKHNNRILNINGAIRKLTPKECWRLMGFSDSDFNTAKQALNDKFYKGKDRSNSQLYKQAGNSIVTNCLIAIFHSLFIENTTDYERYLIDYDK